MKRWEYRAERTPFFFPPTFKQVGSDGWELVSVVYVDNTDSFRLYFKRELPDETK